MPFRPSVLIVKNRQIMSQEKIRQDLSKYDYVYTIDDRKTWKLKKRLGLVEESSAKSGKLDECHRIKGQKRVN